MPFPNLFVGTVLAGKGVLRISIVWATAEERPFEGRVPRGKKIWALVRGFMTAVVRLG